MNRRGVMPADSLSSDTQRFFDVLNDESDHSAIIVGVAYLDACLGAMLQRFLIHSTTSAKLLDPRGGALGTFSARSDVCYALGLISKVMLQDLLVLAELRNQCAHHHLLQSFADSRIADECKKLSFAATLLRWDGAEGTMFTTEQLVNPRTRFTMTAVLLSQRLLVDTLRLNKQVPREPTISTSDET
jgi:DNA-binding MltR family transcriptional regulator